MDPDRLAMARWQFVPIIVLPEEIYDREVDVFVPCAIGAILNDRTIPRLRARIICDGANNQLLASEHDGTLAARSIVYVPDYLANAGGVINFHMGTINDSTGAVLGAVERIGGITAETLTRARVEGEIPLSIADRLVRRRLENARSTT